MFWLAWLPCSAGEPVAREALGCLFERVWLLLCFTSNHATPSSVSPLPLAVSSLCRPGMRAPCEPAGAAVRVPLPPLLPLMCRWMRSSDACDPAAPPLLPLPLPAARLSFLPSCAGAPASPALGSTPLARRSAMSACRLAVVPLPVLCGAGSRDTGGRPRPRRCASSWWCSSWARGSSDSSTSSTLLLVPSTLRSPALIIVQSGRQRANPL